MTTLSEISDKLEDFATGSFLNAADNLFSALGYASDRTLDIHSVAAFRENLDKHNFLNEGNACLSIWQNIHFLFQLTRNELDHGPKQGLLLAEAEPFERKIVESYVFLALEIAGPSPGRTKLAMITRSLNRLFPMPALVLFKHGDHLSIAIVNRRKNMRDGSRDVLTRVSLIRDISIRAPHRAHLELLLHFSLPHLHENTGSIRTFANLDDAWQKVLSVQELNQRFYRELADWFNWAKTEIQLPNLPTYTSDTPQNREITSQEFLVRLICRLLFIWFLKEKKLISERLLVLYDLIDQRLPLTKDLETGNFLEGNHYYRGILQNIFFKALNLPMDQRRRPASEARYDPTVTDPKLKKFVYLGKNYLPDDFDYQLFDRIPYLNGGLFDALQEDNASDTIADSVIRVPNKLFYATRDDGFTVAAGTGNRRAIEGINRIFDRYHFTISENTPLDEDVALDPELLGLVFENLLAEVNPTDEAAAKSARKASGSYYTPRRIVDYMVNESLYLHVLTRFQKETFSREDLQLLQTLFYRTYDEGASFDIIADRVVKVLDEMRVLDPACGSGAFPMGMLHRMTEILQTVDPDNQRWRDLQLAKARDVEQVRKIIDSQPSDFSRKLGLIQHNLFGLDILPLASLITKLRFFIALLVEQEHIDLGDPSHNYGITPLPNLETNVLCANTLEDLPIDIFTEATFKNLRAARDEYYQPGTSPQRREELSVNIGREMATLFPCFAEKVKGIRPKSPEQRQEQDALWIAEWFRHATVPAPFFNTAAFFPELVTDTDGDGIFHIIIGNPPYGGKKISNETKEALTLGSWDPYGAFIARFMGDPKRLSPLAEDGVLAYIVSDTFMTIKTHRPLREQMLRHRIHRMVRVAGNTFKATVNCAVILCQRGKAPKDHSCQMGDLTNVSIHEQYERFLHLLFQTEGFSRRQSVSNQTYGIYHYPQSLIQTNSNIPFFVASPKLFALMNDTTAPVNHEHIRGKNVPVRSLIFNGTQVGISSLGDSGHTNNGLSIGSSNRDLIKRNPLGHSGGGIVYEPVDLSLTLTSQESLSLSISEQKTGVDSYGKRVFVPYDKGANVIKSDDTLVLPNYYAPIQFYVDWSPSAVHRIQSNPNSRVQGAQHYFTDALTYSFLGVYSPTFRLGNGGVFDVGGSPVNSIFYKNKRTLLAVLASKFLKFIFRAFLNHSINLQVEDVNSAPLVRLTARDEALLAGLVSEIVEQQKQYPHYDYASNEQLEIDRLVYKAYGLNEADIKEVEDWYARRYPKLATAQRRALAAKQGRAEKELIERPLINLYCDESRHLPYDRENVMLLGTLACPQVFVTAAHQALREVRLWHRLEPHMEIKWTKVSPAKLDFYQEVLDWFFEQPELRFRCVILPDKAEVYQRLPKDTRDDLYYSLYFQLLRGATEPENRYKVYLDIKDTRGREKSAELKKLLRRDADDASGDRIAGLQHVRSHEVGLLQITDILLGIVGYGRREPEDSDSEAKRALVRHFEERADFNLRFEKDTLSGNEKIQIRTIHDHGEVAL